MKQIHILTREDVRSIVRSELKSSEIELGRLLSKVKELMATMGEANIMANSKGAPDSLELRNIPMSVRLANALNNANVKTIGELRQLSDRELIRQPNFGNATLRELDFIKMAYPPLK